MSLCDKSAAELAEMLRKKQCSAREILFDVMEHAKAVQNELNCYITFNEKALEAADEADRRIAAKENITMLTGIPVAVKDNISTKGIRTTCASRMLENYIPPYCATAVERLEASGAVIIGKTNMDEFAMGSASKTGIFGAVRNPVDKDYSAGGSSGGSAAAVAGGGAILALGSDTGGSVRQPASFCGVVGFCPSYGAVSRYGLIAFASSLDRIGPIGKNVKDTFYLYTTINGRDVKDVTTFEKKFFPNLTGELKRLRIGVSAEMMKACENSDISSAVDDALKSMERQGAEIVKISLSSIRDAVKAYYIISSAEASSNLARFDGVRYGYRSLDVDSLSNMYRRSRTEGFGAEVKRRIMLGTFVLSEGYRESYYKRALSCRRKLSYEFENAFESCDIIATPVYPSAGIRCGSDISATDMYLADIFTVPSSLAGLPAVSVPCGKSTEGLPIGLQLIGKRFADLEVLDAAYGYELTGGMS
ncbi:Asp-tRNA(Asn)/Glu-tRNA(Gln) amidotransferase subunit GatA [Ruminococcus sp.]|uniref:Asp-tRNA(Asn)/Glu-tRNA(Gln) amidotransferase subunit GatA n=1 Tax=Ruminococcus sp. TaxID=41978 RepID=UPI001B3E4AB8|nr:Asp-tRNA(Asn)/Glu-tRNA(Gln) amidotransferase subunit GatA [Ruminococcus sp.]MBP5432807.1 Asp-tRNA(Asn)/Glu-tRNA(Gln) amidotransferase subunit GatA [Ruminococcus sp.]